MVNKNDLNSRLAVSIFVKVAKTIQFMHDSGIAHLDVKPENVLIDDELNPRVMDFDMSADLQDKE